MSVNLLPYHAFSAYDITFIDDLQYQMSHTLAARINRRRLSDKNDLGFTVNPLTYWKVTVYSQMLDQIKYCDSCFEGEEIETIVSNIKNILSE